MLKPMSKRSSARPFLALAAHKVYKYMCVLVRVCLFSFISVDFSSILHHFSYRIIVTRFVDAIATAAEIIMQLSSSGLTVFFPSSHSTSPLLHFWPRARIHFINFSFFSFYLCLSVIVQSVLLFFFFSSFFCMAFFAHMFVYVPMMI